MKKVIIISFACGQGLQLLINYLSHGMVYQNQQVAFCAAAGAIVLVAMIVGAWPDMAQTGRAIEHAAVPEQAEITVANIFGRRKPVEDMDEVAELPEDVIVTNDSVKRVET